MLACVVYERGMGEGRREAEQFIVKFMGRRYGIQVLEWRLCFVLSTGIGEGVFEAGREVLKVV